MIYGKQRMWRRLPADSNRRLLLLVWTERGGHTERPGCDRPASRPLILLSSIYLIRWLGVSLRLKMLLLSVSAVEDMELCCVTDVCLDMMSFHIFFIIFMSNIFTFNRQIFLSAHSSTAL